MEIKKDVTMENFFKGKNILITGHTGFKGSWLSEILINWEANVSGFSLKPPTEPNLFSLLQLNTKMNSYIGDIRNLKDVKKIFNEIEPEIVVHMAAQPLVRESYENPHYTYETNVMGTVNICECIRTSNCVKSFLNVTTDKVYENKEKQEGYDEDEKLDGFDPYSNSKSCSEIITHSYNNSFFKEMNIPTSTARAGNVIGGGDFAKDRIVPDCVKSALSDENIIIRNPYSIRPYQHVLEPLNVYLTIIKKQYDDINYSGYYNVGPDDTDCISTGDLATLFCEKWGENLKWINKSEMNAPHEANFLKLNSSKIKKVFDWKPKWNIDTAIEKTVEWAKNYKDNNDMAICTDKQIEEFFNI
ncbi:CDP-glucose 4,6-dehydratase [Methanobrevibacter sp.]|uniref:CDP-glucose 4,6-dehydratase n=1 Tax=Methanobrevibacter sp. TaxID=66852 RepID=UPI0026DFF5D8|nr:CDP-glucose 4,6-dehydratase [Methanobrevibacter sp.]